MMTRYPRHTKHQKRICVILNASSGTADHDTVRAALDEISATHPVTFELHVLETGRSLDKQVDMALERGFDAIAAAGGDGTITGVAARLRGRGVDMGILPQGTFNFVARGLGIPEDLTEAARLLATGRPRPMPAGEVNGQLFLNNASLGLYPEVLKEREGTYNRWGRSRMAAHWSVLTTFASFEDPVHMEVLVDGKSYRVSTPLAFIARSAYQLDAFGLDGAEAVREGKLALYLAPDDDRVSLLGRALRLVTNGMRSGRDFKLLTGSEIEIRPARRNRTIAMDGERFSMKGPFRFRVLRNALSVIAPA